MHSRIADGRNGLLCLILVLLSVQSLAAEQVYDRRLLQKASVDADKVPLNQLLEDLSKKYKVTIHAHDSLTSHGVMTEPVTLKVEGISLQSLLKLICMMPSAPITFQTDKGIVTVLAEQVVHDDLIEVEYKLTGLGPLTADVSEVAVVLENCTSGPWFETDGVGGKLVSLSPQAVKVSQDRGVHEEIAALLAELQAVVTGRKTAASPIDTVNERVEKALARPTAVVGGEMNLQEGLTQLLGANKIPYLLHTRSLTESGIGPDQMVTLPAGRQSLQDHLTALLAPLGMGFYVQSEVVILTTQESLNDSLMTKVYDIRKRLNPTVFPQDIADRLQQIPETGPWVDADGFGGSVEPIGSLLVVRQNRAAHQKISQALDGR